MFTRLAALPARLSRVFGSVVPWLLIIAAVMAFNIGRAVLADPPVPPRVLGQVPSFALTADNGRAFGSAELQGKAWVANFIFTRCPTVCPAFSAQMAEIERRSRGLTGAFQLVSFSVDPEHDTPEVLHAYARQFRKNPRAWSFVTGDLGALRQIVVDGLKVAMGNEAPDGNFEGIFHGSHFVLVDGEGRIRGYYESSDEDAIDRLLKDAGWIVNERGVIPAS